MCAYALAQLAWAACEDYRMYKTESVCVMKYIADGIERKNIYTGGGDCYLGGEWQL